MDLPVVAQAPPPVVWKVVDVSATEPQTSLVVADSFVATARVSVRPSGSTVFRHRRLSMIPK